MRMQFKYRRLLRLSCLTMLAIVVPGVGVIYTAKYIGMRQDLERAEYMAAEILRRAHRVSEQLQSAFSDLDASPDGLICSEPHMDIMRKVVVKSNMLVDVGVARGHQMLCSSFGYRPIDIGPSTFVSDTGYIIRARVPHPLQPQSRLLLITHAKTGVTAEVHEDTVLDLSPENSELAIGVLGWTHKRALMQRGSFDPSWLQGVGAAFETSKFDGQSIVAFKRSRKYDYAVYVAIPNAEWLRTWQRIIFTLMPLGGAMSLALLFAVRLDARQQASMPSAIRQALKTNDFFLVYQPIVDLATGHCVGAEALLRWRRNGQELVSPDVFIPAAERNHLIGRITEKLLVLIERDTADLLRHREDFYIAINLSADDFNSPNLPARLHEQMVRMGLRRGALHVEATERVFMNNEVVKRNLKALRTQGVPTAIDDFGTGYSSLAYLTHLELDYLKIDKAFVDTISTDSVTSHVVAHIIEMAKSLGLKMVAEGVETEQQAAYLKMHGVQYAQGWYFSKPVPMEQLRAQLT